MGGRNLAQASHFVDKFVGPFLAAGPGATNGRYYGMTKDGMDELKMRLALRWPSQLVIEDRNGCTVQVQPTHEDVMLIFVDADGNPLHDINRMFSDALLRAQI